MMAQKARLFNDSKNLSAILRCATPAEAKALGRKITLFDAKLWNKYCFDYVVQGNIYKFSQHPELKTFLLKTHQRILVEASPYDRIWGVRMKMSHPNPYQPKRWRGKNQLGFTLMAAPQALEISSSLG